MLYCVFLSSLKLGFSPLENLAADSSFLGESCWHWCGLGTQMVMLGQFPKNLSDSSWNWSLWEFAACNRHLWPCCMQLSRNGPLLPGLYTWLTTHWDKQNTPDKWLWPSCNLLFIANYCYSLPPNYWGSELVCTFFKLVSVLHIALKVG